MMKNIRNKYLSIILIIVFALSFAACGAGENGDAPEASTVNGKVQGFYEDGAAKFYGIPFAEPPIDELRFAPPRNPENWEDVLSCTEMKPSALQMESESRDLEYSEDCLYLDVWAPEDAKAEDGLPVFVFIHGGAFVQGSPNMPTYDGTEFANDGIIQVNLPYRLNALGFTAFEEMEDEYGYLGNTGLLDQIKGLEWIQENIDAFGGDPENVTICGESAGSMSVSSLMLAKDAEGLFDKAIMESGTILAQEVIAPESDGDRNNAIAMTDKLMKAVGAGDIDELRKTDGMDLVENSTFSFDVTVQTPQYFFPVFDGRLLPVDPYDAVTGNKMNDVDILTGFNTDEGSIFIPEDMTEEDYNRYLKTNFGENADAVRERYPVEDYGSYTEVLRYLVKINLAAGSQVFADTLTERGEDAYLYEFAYSTPELDEAGLGAYHSFELGFVFGTLGEDFQDDTSLKVQRDLHQRWLNFIVSGDPNKSGDSGEDGDPEVKWPVYSSDKKQVLKIDETSSAETWPLTEDVEFLKTILWKN